ncbi:MAG: ABC transporter substrate-binding protein [Methylococcaceae bacterium]|jgi:phospholipid transport system substrate-binding protein
MKVKHYGLLFFLTLLLGVMSSASAVAAELLPAQQAIEDASSKLKERMKDKTFIQDFAKITQFVNDAINPHTDFDKISALVLGQNWKTATADERERFKHEFQTLLVRTYSRAFVEFKDWSVQYLPIEMEDGSNKVIVKTEVLQPGVQPVAVNYRMFLGADGVWKAYDIIIEGVSLVTNYRTTFSNEVRNKGSLNAVIESLAKRNAEALANKSSANTKENS